MPDGHVAWGCPAERKTPWIVLQVKPCVCFLHRVSVHLDTPLELTR